MVGTPVVWAEYPTPHKIILDEGWEWGHETELAKPDRKYPNHETYCGTCGACTYKPWQGLTDSDMQTIRDDAFVKNVDDIDWALQMARKIETKLKRLNT